MVITWLPGYITMDIVCPEREKESISWLIAGCQLTPGKEEPAENGKVIFRNISGKPKDVSVFMKSVEESYWDMPDKVYLMFRLNKEKGKKADVQEDREESDTGCEGGDREGTDLPGEHGEAEGACGNPDSDRDPGFEPDSLFETGSAADDDCD